jgi:hypothetical protein
MSCEKQEGMSLQVSAKQFVYEFRKKVWLTEGLTHDAKSPICGCGSFFELTNPSQVEEQGLGFPREHFLFGRSVVEGELGLGAYQSFLAERNLSEEEGDALLTEAFRVCRPLELHALSAIVTRTEKLCASVLEISQERKEMTCDKYKGTAVGESSWPFVSHRCSTARGTVTGEELTTLHHSILPASLNETRGDRVIHVCASAPERPFEQVSISIRTAVTLTGDWTRMLDIRCAACERGCRHTSFALAGEHIFAWRTPGPRPTRPDEDRLEDFGKS